MRKFRIISVLLCVSVFISACGGGSSNQAVVHKSGHLISAKQLVSYSNKAVEIEGIETQYAVKVYRITYETKGVDGAFINASGLLSIPQKTDQAKSPILAFHHGVIYHNKEAPTENVNAGSSSVLPAFVGFIVAAPDYIGYGESLGVTPAFSNAKITASTSVDLLRASKVFLKDNNIKSNEQLFLGGYSQGGGATLAVQRLIESELTDEFTVTASSAGAGAYHLSYDLLLSAEEVLQNFDTLTIGHPSNIGLLFKAMDSAYQLNILERAFPAEYAAIIDTIYDGSHYSNSIDAKLNHYANELFNKDFVQNLVDGEEQDLVDAFKDNDLIDWAPKAPTMLYHGREDRWVRFDHADHAYDALSENGATQLTLVECVTEGNLPTNHSNCFTPYLFSSFAFFSQYANDL